MAETGTIAKYGFFAVVAYIGWKALSGFGNAATAPARFGAEMLQGLTGAIGNTFGGLLSTADGVGGFFGEIAGGAGNLTNEILGVPGDIVSGTQNFGGNLISGGQNAVSNFEMPSPDISVPSPDLPNPFGN